MPGSEATWRPLFRAGAITAIGVIALVPIQVVVFLLWPLPESVVGWFELFNKSALIGLLDLDLLLLIDYLFIGVTFLAIGAALWRANPSLVLLALAIELMAIAAYLPSNPAIELWSLSGKYAAAATEAERTVALAAGEGVLAGWTGTAFTVSYIMCGIAMLTMSAVMLRSGVFSRATAYAGLITGAFNLVPANAGTLGLVFSLVSLIPMLVWFALVARRLLQLARGEAEAPTVVRAPPRRLVPQH